MSRLTFSRKPMPILAEYRPMYKISQVLLILYLSSRGKKSSLIRLHLISWVLKDESRKAILIESIKKEKILFGVWGVDPSVNLAIQYAEAERLMIKDGTSYKLTTKGVNFCKCLDSELVFPKDFNFLKSIGASVTEKMVNSIVDGWE